MKILIIGRGGREHAIAWKMAQSALNPELFVAPGNIGMCSITKKFGVPFQCVPIDEKDTDKLLQFAINEHIELTIVGPEAALMNGIADAFHKAGQPIFAPTQSAARIEGSKQFAKELMQKYNIPTADYRVFDQYEPAKRYIEEKGTPIVIKYDGLAAGKGVVVALNTQQADAALQDMLLHHHFGHGKVVVEEFLEGPEFSLLALVNGSQVVPLLVAQDHKRAYDGDKGPNTGGMGAYAPVSVIPQPQVNWAVEHIMKPVATAMVTENCPFCGVLYGGLILTAQGPKVIEFNARFGDPETEVVLPALKSDLLQLILDVMAHKEVTPEFYKECFLGVVMASKGYPGSYGKGAVIRNLDNIPQTVFHMGTTLEDGEWKTNGGRVLFVLGKGLTMQEARNDAYNGVQQIDCSELFYRNDIGQQVL